MNIAMKIEEVELHSLRSLLGPPPPDGREPLFGLADVHIMERKVVSVLKFKLLPDTLYFWFDLVVKLWDTFITYDCSEIPNYPLFKPPEGKINSHEYDPMKPESKFKLGIPNPYRVLVQALDLMSLHFKIHDYCRPNLVIGLCAVQFLYEIGLLHINSGSHPKTLKDEILHWASAQSEEPDDYFKLFRKFLSLYCASLLPENFETSNWAELLCSEMQFSSQFFILPPQYMEPTVRKKVEP